MRWCKRNYLTVCNLLIGLTIYSEWYVRSIFCLLSAQDVFVFLLGNCVSHSFRRLIFKVQMSLALFPLPMRLCFSILSLSVGLLKKLALNFRETFDRGWPCNKKKWLDCWVIWIWIKEVLQLQWNQLLWGKPSITGIYCSGKTGKGNNLPNDNVGQPLTPTSMISLGGGLHSLECFLVSVNNIHRNSLN